jgi:HD superfamily phosphohydrolase
MDYLVRDSYFCGTQYGQIELNWLIGNLTFNIIDNNVYLALNRKALYTFDHFLLARHHMYLMVYFHHKCIIYDEMLQMYLHSKDCPLQIPSNINDYLKFTDYFLYQHLAQAKNYWAQRISKNEPLRVLYELHSSHEDERPNKIKQALDQEGLLNVLASSEAWLSKYHPLTTAGSSRHIYVVNSFDRKEKPYPIEQSSEIFQKYEKARKIERIYVDPSQYAHAKNILDSF